MKAFTCYGKLFYTKLQEYKLISLISLKIRQEKLMNGHIMKQAGRAYLMWKTNGEFMLIRYIFIRGILEMGTILCRILNCFNV